MGSSLQTRIDDRFTSIEADHGVRIFYACESGSRAWGFESADSDFDVRFIYAHRLDWYLSVDLEQKRDVIEIPPDHGLDMSGWDLRKALGLLWGSNPPLLEWLRSPIVYREVSDVPKKLRSIAAKYYSPRSCRHHYLSMAEHNFRHYLTGERVAHKKYFYVLRPILAIRWIEEGRGIVPTALGDLLDTLVPHGPLRDAVAALIARKRAEPELGLGPRIAEISDFIEKELQRMKCDPGLKQTERLSAEPLNALFREALEELWPSPVRGSSTARRR